jgi:hypothetical protein
LKYIIPGIAIAGIVALANISEPVSQPSASIQENNLSAPDIQTAPQSKTPDEIQTPVNEVEPKNPTPAPTPVPPPAAKPEPKIIPLTPKPNCDSNYSGCVPVASDVDCAGGSGNGPAYVRGPVEVIGIDVYDLDRNGDGVACE